MSELLGGRTGGVGDGDGGQDAIPLPLQAARLLTPSSSLTFSRFFEIQIQGTCHIYAAHPILSPKKKTTRGANNNDNLDTLIAPPSNNSYKTANNNLSTKPSAKQKNQKKSKTLSSS